MNKGTAVIGFFLCFVTGMGLMFAIDRGKGGASLSAEPTAATAAADQSSSPIPVTNKDPQVGNADALVTIVQVSDFQCPFCSRVEPTITQIRQKYKPDQVRVVWKNNPLPFHPNARPAADAAMTVFGLGGNDAFWKFHGKVFENQKDMSDANYEKWAVESGVPLDKYKAALASKKFTSKVDEDLALSRKIGINGTPGFRINGVLVSGAQPLPKFTEVIDAQLKAAQDLIKSGTKKSEVSLALTKTNFTAPEAKPAPSDNGPPAADNTVWRVDIAPDDPQRGPKNAAITIVEWSDFQCPFCAKVEPTLKQVRDTYKDDVRFVWKDNPLPFHPRAKPAATLARAAYAKGGDALFWKAHDEMYDGQKIEDADLEALAKKLGLDWSAVKAAIDSNKYADHFSKTMDQADSLEARGTPHFFVNGVRLTGAQPWESFKATIDTQLAKAKGILKNGVAPDQVYAEIMKTAKAAGTLDKKDVPPPTKDNPVKGAAGGKVVIHEWSDFQCPFCGRVEPTIKQIMDKYGDKVKVVWHNMPLPFHENAGPAAEAAYEVLQQKGSAGFWAFHDKLYSNQQALTRPDLEKTAQELGVDMAKFKAALDSHSHKAAIDADAAAGQKLGVNGTPAFFVNGYFLSGAQPYEKFEKLINVALKE